MNVESTEKSKSETAGPNNNKPQPPKYNRAQRRAAMQEYQRRTESPEGREMKIISGFPLRTEIVGDQEIEMQIDAEILQSPTINNKRLTVWAVVDLNKEKEIRFFRVCMAGDQMEDRHKFRHIGARGLFHVFLRYAP